MNAVSVRGDWVGQVIDGRYPLLEWLGGSGTSGTFLTELDGLGSRKAALKLLPSSPLSEDRLAGWANAAKLANAHLARIHHYGRAEVDGNACVYIVFDLAEELLSQIIPERPLTADEARQMLEPILGALEFLHNEGYIHGHLKPSNVLVVENEIRLSSDALLPIGKPAPELLTNDIHTAPEIATEPVSPRADVWSIGVTLVESLTQQLPIWDAASDAEPVLPGSIPAPFAEIARRCLHADPVRRCTLAEIRALLAGPARLAAVKSGPAESTATGQDRPAGKPLPARMPFLPLVIGFVLVAAIIVGLQLHRRTTITASPEILQTPSTEPQSQPAPPRSNGNVARTTKAQTAAPIPSSSAPAAGDVITRNVPDVPQRARNTIHGTVSVAVRVDVDSNGSVTDAKFDQHGPSAYFARLALQSSRNWRFKPSQQDGRAVGTSWLLHYKFRRDDTEVDATQVRPK